MFRLGQSIRCRSLKSNERTRPFPVSALSLLKIIPPTKRLRSDSCILRVYSARVVSNGRELLKALEKEAVDITFDGLSDAGDGRICSHRRDPAPGGHCAAHNHHCHDGQRSRRRRSPMFGGRHGRLLSKPVKPDALRLKLDRWSKLGGSGNKRNEASQPEQRSKDIIDQAQLATLRTIPIANFCRS